MGPRTIVVALLIACSTLTLFTSETDAYSDRIGIYARIEKVVLEPNATAPERIQIWGAFALASKGNIDSYDPAQRGYLYYSLKPGKEEQCRKDWADFKALAATEQIVGFGTRLHHSRLRKTDDKPADPDVYPVSYGVVKISDRGSEYGPIRDLKSLPRETR